MTVDREKKYVGQVVNNYLTQILSGHGNFGQYLHKMHRENDNRRMYCGKSETAEQAFFKCQRWESIRQRLELLLEERVSSDNIVEFLLEGNKSWRIVQGNAEEIS